MVQEEGAGDVVERAVPVGRPVQVDADESQPSLGVAPTPGTVERVRANVERGDPQVEPVQPTPPRRSP